MNLNFKNSLKSNIIKFYKNPSKLIRIREGIINEDNARSVKEENLVRYINNI